MKKSNEPTIEVQPVKHGRWSECYTDSRLYSGICSVCGGAAIRSVTANPLGYCPNCGARMGGGNTAGEMEYNMYIFRLHVTNTLNGCSRTINIAISETIARDMSEKMVYVHAMSKAYDIVSSMDGYCFDKLVFILHRR